MTGVLPVEIGDGIHWINTCYSTEQHHHHISPYVVEGPDGYVLIETGSIEHQDEIRERVEALTGESGVDAAILSHYDLPHVANARAFREAWEFDLYTSFSGTSANPKMLGMGPSVGCMHEEPREIGGRIFDFPWPPLVDAAHSMWVYDTSSQTIFAADMGHYHVDGACADIIDTEAEMVSVEEIRAYNEDALPFTKYLDPASMRDAFAELREQYEPEVWAPTHGNPIVGSELIELYHDRYVAAIESTRATADL